MTSYGHGQTPGPPPQSEPVEAPPCAGAISPVRGTRVWADRPEDVRQAVRHRTDTAKQAGASARAPVSKSSKAARRSAAPVDGAPTSCLGGRTCAHAHVYTHAEIIRLVGRSTGLFAYDERIGRDIDTSVDYPRLVYRDATSIHDQRAKRSRAHPWRLHAFASSGVHRILRLGGLVDHDKHAIDRRLLALWHSAPLLHNCNAWTKRILPICSTLQPLCVRLALGLQFFPQITAHHR